MKLTRRAVTAAAVTAATGCGLLLFTGPQAQAAARASYNGACGSGYKVVNSAPIGTSGTVFLTYNSNIGTNCVVTVRNTPGDPVFMVASLITSDAIDPKPEEDIGEYRSYAGPVYVDAAGKCVNWGGVIGGEGVSRVGTNCGALATDR
ncbi:spore-associated protein A [Streptomyces daliensis]